MENIAFIKMHGLGNDFVIIDAREIDYGLTNEQVQQIADRHTGVGCDQLVIIKESDKSDCFVHFYNPDGSESGACGNASRCVAWLIMEQTDKKQVSIATNNGVLLCNYVSDQQVCVNMGPAKTHWQDIPLSYEADTLNLDIQSGQLTSPTAVSMGNPHAVFFVDDVQNTDLEEHGPILENHQIFPQRANIGVAQIDSPDKITLRVWERGTGLTQACGTGACAAAVAANLRGLTGDKVTVSLPGGDLQIQVTDDHVLMTGPVATSFIGIIK